MQKKENAETALSLKQKLMIENDIYKIILVVVFPTLTK